MCFYTPWLDLKPPKKKELLISFKQLIHEIKAWRRHYIHRNQIFEKFEFLQKKRTIYIKTMQIE
jgi:hypothetical protein